MAIIRVYTPTEVKELSHGDNLRDCKTMSYEEFYNDGKTAVGNPSDVSPVAKRD